MKCGRGRSRVPGSIFEMILKRPCVTFIRVACFDAISGVPSNASISGNT